MAEAILVLLRHPEETSSLLGAAARLAEMMGGARINALAIRETVQIAPAAALTLADRTDALLLARDDERLRVLDLRKSCDDWTVRGEQWDTEVHWFEAEGGTADVVAEWGQRADVIVAGQPAQGDSLGQQAFRTALFGTGRPILMVPSKPAIAEAGRGFGRSVAIAWRDEKQTLRAVLPALRWLAGAAEVHVLVGVRNTAQSPAVPPVLLEHGLAANLHVLALRPGPFGQTLLDVAHRLSADMLVMGVYAHNPLRELVLGGVTRHMLAYADLPVLMRH